MGFVEQMLMRGKEDLTALIGYAFPYSPKTREILKDTRNVIPISDYDAVTMAEFYKLEIIDALICRRFIEDKDKLDLLDDLKTRLYLIPVSKDRGGRKEIFETVQAKIRQDQDAMKQSLRP